MISRTATIGAKSGLHARPAALFVNAVNDSGAEVTISFDGNEADASSLLEVITLGAERGDEVTLMAEDSAASVLDELVELLSRSEA
ncbi:phosphocarrier protein [Bowdeniella nasicola]|uniref:Phosphocarrier protein HPr n=1 Tax=Bowdeniella nasicola TaxID=208480 RepID=A0A1H3X1Q2_9ACTO|nr:MULTISPECIES: HPr family phosphocarrier protein [Bowdeniella]SDZ93316.1 phosphocarrier protein [Bowdeniella nasicola]